MTKTIAAETTANQKYYKKLTDEFGLRLVTRKDILKLKLYEEQGECSIYTGQTISMAKLFTTDEYDIDHIIPQSRLFDDSQANKVLCESWVNREKGNMTALDSMHTKGEAALRDYTNRIKGLNSLSLAKKQRLLMNLEKIPDDFINRQLKESQYIVREALVRMRAICREVTSTTGSVTGFLRHQWGLSHIMQEINRERYEALGRWRIKEGKNGQRIPDIEGWTKRDDHRHHAVDALVVACTSQGIIQRLNSLNAAFEEFQRAGEKRLRFPVPWTGFHADAARAMNHILISFKGKNKVSTWNKNRTKTKDSKVKHIQRTLTPRGPLHKDTVYARHLEREAQRTPLNKKFNRPDLIISPRLRELVTARWAQFQFDPVKAAASLKKAPLLWKDRPLLEVQCWKEQYSIRKAVGPGLTLDKVVDPTIRALLQERLNAYGGDDKKAFINLEQNPIWLVHNDRVRIPVKKVTLYDNGNLIALRHNGTRPVDFVYTRNNHHAAIYAGPEGEKKLDMVPFFEATERRRQGLPVIAPANAEGWPLAYFLQKNDYWLFDVDPVEVDIYDPANRAALSPHLFRVQKLSANESGSPYFVFRHHLETTLKNEDFYAYRRIRSFPKLTGFKVHINRLGSVIKSH